MKLESNKWYAVSEHKLEKEEIEGRIVFELYKGPDDRLCGNAYHPESSMPTRTIEEMASTTYPTVCYMLMPVYLPEEQPLELDGAKPEIWEVTEAWRVQYGDMSKFGRQLAFLGKTRPEAIHNANEFIRRVKDE